MKKIISALMVLMFLSVPSSSAQTAAENSESLKSETLEKVSHLFNKSALQNNFGIIVQDIAKDQSIPGIDTFVLKETEGDFSNFPDCEFSYLNDLTIKA
ncbi:MAG: hypothetical protein KAI33_10165, partial [Elusimicrobiales bacterium]|nr:hypothetical protein [Elusimicrobiales bacterium]